MSSNTETGGGATVAEQDFASYIISLQSDETKQKDDLLVFAVDLLVRRVASACKQADIPRYPRDKEFIKDIPFVDVVVRLIEMLEARLSHYPEGTSFDDCILSDADNQYLSYLVGHVSVFMDGVVREMVEAHPHCDDPQCDLGFMEYNCLNCGKPVIDYGLWWQLDELEKDAEFSVTCNRCHSSMDATYDGSCIWLKKNKFNQGFLGTPANNRFRR